MNKQTRTERRAAGQPQPDCRYCFGRGSETYLAGERFKLAWPCRCLTRQMPAHEARLKSLGDIARLKAVLRNA